jgi:hypothetical protein
MIPRRFASLLLSLLALPVCLSLAGCSSLYAISILPASGSVVLTAVGQTAQFTAYGSSQMGNGSPTTGNITTSVTWAVSNPQVATISASGLATAVGTGHTQITAESSGIIATSDLTVTTSSGSSGTPSITVTPGTATETFIGETTQFIATGSLTGGTAQNLTTQVQWSSSNVQVAAINPSTGLATAVGAGATTITAQSGGTIATATLTVVVNTTASNATLAIIPTSATASFVGETTQFIALGNLSGGTATQDLTGNVTWSSSDVAIATIDKNGLATAIAANVASASTTITAIGTTSTGSLIVATSVLTVQPAGGSVGLPALAVYLAGAGTGTVSGTVGTAQPTINCGSATAGSSCTNNFPLNSIVTLTATPNGHFGGWSSNCLPVLANPNPLVCTIQMKNNETVGAIFNP